MLHPLYSMRSKGYDAEYDASLSRNALQTFFQALPDHEEDYVEGIRRMYAHLYDRALLSSGNRYFVDKTPRYYFIIAELFRIFPNAYFIILLRNPLAVLVSILNTWTKENWFSLFRFKHDLIQAPDLLLNGTEILGDRCTIVRYERLLTDAKKEIKGICQQLGIDFFPEMVEYGRQDLPRWPLGDQETIYKNVRPALQNVNKWEQSLKNVQFWRVANDYLQLLDRQTLKRMGYPYDELKQVLEAYRPRWIHLRLTFPLAWLINKPFKCHKRLLRRVVQLKRSFQRRGIRGTAVYAITKLVHGMITSERPRGTAPK